MELKDTIDFGKENVSKLFRKMLYPTLLGMLFSALFTITDGIFVGRGLGSDALAAVNITAPLFMLATGIGLMFGMGASVVASIHLAGNKLKIARINVTQSIVVASLLMVICSVLVMIFPYQVLSILGCSERLTPLAIDYLKGFVPFLISLVLITSCGFFVRLSGAPNYAMVCTVVSAVINIILDYLLIFVFKWGMFGAAFATGIGTTVGVIMMIFYLLNKKNTIHFVSVKLSKKSFLLTCRNIGYMCKLGFSSFLGEIAIASMMICGNYVFMKYMGEDGVAAFSVACYFFPIVFMVYTSIGQSAQPIISYNYGAGCEERAKASYAIALKYSLFCGLIAVVLNSLFSTEIVSMFITEDNEARRIAIKGLPLFAFGFIPFAINMISVGYFQSVERIKYATILTLLRGFVFMILSFIVLPKLVGNAGVWLAVPLSEMLTFLFVISIYLKGRKTNPNITSC